MKDQQTKKIEESEKDRNFFKIQNEIVDSGLLAVMKPSEVKVHLVIGRHIHYKHGRAFPSIESICKLSGMNKNVVCKATKRLEYYGVIKRYRAPLGLNFRTVYQIVKNPKINPLVIPQKAKKRIERYRKKDGKFGVIPQNMETVIFPQNVELHTIPQNMEGKEIEIELNRDSLKKKQQSFTISKEIIKKYRKLKGDKWIRKYLLDHGYSLTVLNEKRPKNKQIAVISKMNDQSEGLNPKKNLHLE